MKEKRELNEELENLAQQVINENSELSYITCSSVKIAYLTSNLVKKRGKDGIVFGQCEKIPGRYKWGIHADFAITVFTPNTEYFTPEQLKILLFHELLHVGIEKQQDGEESFYVKNHDLEDFKIIIDKYGTSWDKAQ